MAEANELVVPVKTGFKADEGFHRRNYRSIEDFLASPHISSAQIIELSADKITSGTISSTVLVTGLIQSPSASGYRVEIGNVSYPLRYWNGTTTKLSVDTSGNVAITGAITATSGSITGTLDVSGLIRAPSSGYRVEIGNATYPLRYWNGTTTNFAVDTSGNITLVGTIQSSGGVPLVRSGGYPRAKVSEDADQTIADSTPENLDWSGATTITDTDSFVVTASDAFNMTFTGQYMVFCQVRWASNSDSTPRRLKAQKNGVDIPELTDSRRAHAGAFPTTCNVAAVADFTAGDDLTFGVYQESSGNLNVTDWNAQIVFLGPA